MKFYTYELWQKLNSEVLEERKNARDILAKNGQEYFEIFQAIKDKLPKYFIRKYIKYNGFHDFQLENIEIYNQVKKLNSIKILISKDNERFQICYSDITNLSITYNISKVQLGIRDDKGFDSWGYSEFSELRDREFTHEILFASGATILIHFKKIKIVEVK